jgi:hypothetical protein
MRQEHSTHVFLCLRLLHVPCVSCLAHSPAPTCHAYLEVPRSVGTTHYAPTLPCSVHRSQFPALLRVHVHASADGCCRDFHRWNRKDTGGIWYERNSTLLRSILLHLACTTTHNPRMSQRPRCPWLWWKERQSVRTRASVTSYSPLHVLHEPPTHVLVTPTTLPCACDTNHSPMCL